MQLVTPAAGQKTVDPRNVAEAGFLVDSFVADTGYYLSASAGTIFEPTKVTKDQIAAFRRSIDSNVPARFRP